MSEPESTISASETGQLARGVASPRGEYRRFAWLCALLLSAHLLALFLPASCRKAFSECLFLADSGLALFYMNRARLRSAGSVRIFWVLFSAALWLFVAGTLFWLCEVLLGWVPSQELLVISYRLYAVPLAMILFVPGEVADQREFTKEATLDFLQLGILAWLAMFVLFYLPTRSLALRDLQHFGAIDLGNKINLLLLALSYIRWKMENSPQMRWLRGRLAIFVALYSVVSATGNYVDVSGDAAPAAWLDPVWALPYLLAAGVAVTWDSASQTTPQTNLRRTLRGLMLESLPSA
jgi:ABC-type multidrug transport system fused ATPase/permease subunit